MKRLDRSIRQDRRKQARLNLFKNIINNTAAVKVPDYVLGNTDNSAITASQSFLPLRCKIESLQKQL